MGIIVMSFAISFVISIAAMSIGLSFGETLIQCMPLDTLTTCNEIELKLPNLWEKVKLLTKLNDTKSKLNIFYNIVIRQYWW